MKNLCAFLILALIGTAGVFAQDVTGKWKTIDDETGDAKSIVEVYKKDGKVFGKVIEILNKDRQDVKCMDCPGADNGKPVKGLVIIKGLEKDGNEYADGKILDPQSGKLYKCLMELESPNKLKVRGYVGFSLLGRTQYWTRVN